MHTSPEPITRLSRRQLLKAVPAILAGAPALARRLPPNLLFLLVDQLSLNAIGAHGCRWARTPNLDRLARRGVSFQESHSTNPVCSPARSSLLTGRMPVETGVVNNGIPIRQSIPNLGQWFGGHGYETVYCGKWHLPQTWEANIPGFTTIPLLGEGEGDVKDPLVAMASEAYLHSRSRTTPFLLLASLLQPHDICFWAIDDYTPQLVPQRIPFGELAGPLPELPPNTRSRPPEPRLIAQAPWRPKNRSDEQWRFYLYNYYRMVEMLDADVGRILDALEASGAAEDTVVLLTSDHGDGGARHGNVQKHFPYEEAVKVPMIVSAPGMARAGRQDTEHLVSGLDVMSTLCDYAGIPAPTRARGLSLRPLVEGREVKWRSHVVAEAQEVGRMVRTAQYKYVLYQNDPVEQLFDIKADPWEMSNLYRDARYASVRTEHRRLLAEWESSMEMA